jgi:hypothetical protein
MHCKKVHFSTSGAGWLGTPIVLVVPHACFELSWLWRLEVGFFLKSKKDIDTKDDNIGKHFLSVRSLNRK